MPHPTFYEYEERAFLREDQFLSIKETLHGLALSHELDNKTSYFFVLPYKNVSIAVSKKKAVIKYKAGQLGLGNGFEELEVPIEASSLQSAVKLLTVLLGIEPQLSEQFRINYQLSNGIEVALKYTQTWGFHMEIEKTYTHSEHLESEKQRAKEALDAIAKKLGITYIDDATMETAKKAWAAGEQFGAYTPKKFLEKYGTLFN